MTQEEKIQRLEELRTLWRKTKNDTDRRIIQIRANLLKLSLPQSLISPIDNK